MYPRSGELPTPLGTKEELDSLDAVAGMGDVNETPFNVFIGHNLGHRVFTMSVPFRKFFEISDVANDRDNGPVAQRQLDPIHAKKLAIYMLKGLVSAAKLRRELNGKDGSDHFDQVLKTLGEQPYFSIQPIVCNIRNIPLGGSGPNSIRAIRLETKHGETAGFKVFLAEKHILWVIDGQHRRRGADLAMNFLETVRHTGRYPAKTADLFPDKGNMVSEIEMSIWNEAWDAARSYATLTVEVHLGLNIEQERQLFHDLNRLGKKVDISLALQFDSSNPITSFIKSKLFALGIQLTDSEVKDWDEDQGKLVIKDAVAVNAIAFLNKGNVAGATPAVVEPREPVVENLWSKIVEIPDFGATRSKEKTVAAQPVVLKALAKITYDLKFSNRRPENADDLFEMFLEKIPTLDFSHTNPMWRYYEMTPEERATNGIGGLTVYVPEDGGGANRDIGAFQSGLMRFGAKHNDIFPILADMIRWASGLPSRRSA